MQIAEVLTRPLRKFALPTLPTLLMLMGAAPLPAPRRRVPGEGSIALVNRHTGRPHQHKREIARRLRQTA